MEKLVTVADENVINVRMSDYLRKILGFSTTLVTRVKFGGVFLNDETVTMRARVNAGDTVTVFFPPEESENIPPIDIPLDIIYEDEHILAVNKPSDMPTHPSKGNNLPTLANAVRAYLGEGFVFRAVNRLDRGTSGIVIIAKNPFAASNLGRAMKERRIHKKYRAVVSGIPSPEEGIIDLPIERECEGSIKRVVREDGKRAITEYRVLEKREDASLVLVTLHTGRTHQIRVHFSHLGHPLVGDFLYGEERADGYSLVCSEIILPHPLTNEEIILKL
jgi:23S rRNA pseudouridine1911/1915/1917 synthase